jgi:hypothetical protein
VRLAARRSSWQPSGDATPFAPRLLDLMSNGVARRRSHSGHPGGRSGCWSGCSPWRPRRGERAASSNCRPSRRWPCRPAATRPAPLSRWPRRSLWARPRAGCAASSTRAPDGRTAPQLLASRRQQRPAAAIPRDYLARLADAFERAGLPIRPPARRGLVVAGLVEPLTARELEVLQRLAAGEPNRAIAQRLVVTPRRSRNTSATCSASWGWPTAPRPSPGPAS